MNRLIERDRIDELGWYTKGLSAPVYMTSNIIEKGHRNVASGFKRSTAQYAYPKTKRN